MLKALALENLWSPFLSKPRTRTIAQNESGNTRFWIGILLIALNGIVLMSYVYGVNKFASSGYEIKLLQNRLTELTESNRQINLKVAETTSIVNIQSDYLSSNFVPAGTAKFLEVNQFTMK